MIEKVHLWYNKTGGIWDEIIDVILKGVNNRVKERKTDLNLTTLQLPTNSDVKTSANDINIVVCPLFKIENDQLLPNGLISICSNKLYEKFDFNFNTIFIIANKADMPDPFNPHRDMTYYAKNLISNPKFGGMGKALLMLELIFKQKEVINIVDIYSKKLLDDILLAIMAVKEISQSKCYYGWRASFYKTFVKFYDDFENANKTHIDLNAPNDLKKTATKDKNITWENLQQANDFYNHLNCTLKQRQSAHHVPLELFRAPIPFPLQELVDARDEINRELKKGGMDKKIKLLLIDNRSDNKFISQNGDSSNLNFKPESLCNLLFSENNGFGLGDIFEIQMIGKSVYKKKEKENTPQFYQNGNDTKLSNYSDFEREYEEFKFKKFKNKTLLTTCEKEYHKAFGNKQNKPEIEIENYADLVYHKIKDAHFVLLDFFLDNDDTYLAFDFIRDMADIKRKQGDVSTTWYFITSAVYDSVMKYSQSGLLAEYYESAVVSAGDDPTNKKRQIIFLYKLLTFINARFKNFCSLQETIYDRLLKDKDKDCEHWDKQEKKCKKNGIKCLEKEILGVIRRYLNEFNDVKDIFFSDETEIEKWQDIVESLENVIKQFIWLPEADWYMIQHQIDFINNKLGGLQDKKLKECKFSFKYILEELKDRSEVY